MSEWRRGEYVISTDRERLDLEAIHGFLRTTYWAEHRSRERVERSIRASIPFGLYHQSTQVGFARVLTDYVVLAFVADVFVLPEHRGQGIGTWLMESLTRHEELQAVRRWLLTTRDAHDLYAKVGFGEPIPGRLMERLDLDADLRERRRA